MATEGDLEPTLFFLPWSLQCVQLTCPKCMPFSSVPFTLSWSGTEEVLTCDMVSHDMLTYAHM